MRSTLITVTILIVSLAAPSFVFADGRGHRDRDHRDRDTVASMRHAPGLHDARDLAHDRGRHLGWEKGKAERERERYRDGHRKHSKHDRGVVRVVERPRVTHRHVTYAYRDHEPCHERVVVVRPHRPPVSSSFSFFISW